MSLEPGQTIEGKYRVVRHIGEGGMGTVYEGMNVRIERRVAIKVLHAHVASNPQFAERFEREARAAARIGSAYVCDVLDLGDLPNGERYIVMEFLDGMSLEDRLSQDGRMSVYELAPIAFEMLEGLGTMHHAKVIHRDLKPANVFLARTGNRRGQVVKILDFGVAKVMPRADEPNQMTNTGMMMGTPLYMSPEQARGARDVDARTDLYAASVIFYRALTGELPYTAENLHELLFKIVLEDPKPIATFVPDIDEAFAAIVMKGLARDPDQRYASAREYQEAIAAWGKGQGRSSLAFTISLPSEPPPLLPISGSMPVVPSLGSLTPLSGSTPRVSSGTAAYGDRTKGQPKPSGKTPTAWSEDGPSMGKPLSELTPPPAAARTQRISVDGPTESAPSRPPSHPGSVAPASAGPRAPASVGASVAQAPPAAEASARKRATVAVVASLALALGAVITLRLGMSSTATSPAAAAASASAPIPSAAPPGSVASSAVPVEPGQGPGAVATADPAAEGRDASPTTVSTASTESARTASTARPANVGGASVRPTGNGRAQPSPAAPAPSAEGSTTTPATSASSRRRFRTSID